MASKFSKLFRPPALRSTPILFLPTAHAPSTSAIHLLIFKSTKRPPGSAPVIAEKVPEKDWVPPDEQSVLSLSCCSTSKIACVCGDPSFPQHRRDLVEA